VVLEQVIPRDEAGSCTTCSPSQSEAFLELVFFLPLVVSCAYEKRICEVSDILLVPDLEAEDRKSGVFNGVGVAQLGLRRSAESEDMFNPEDNWRFCQDGVTKKNYVKCDKKRNYTIAVV
jgi:hypothetical protein